MKSISSPSRIWARRSCLLAVAVIAACGGIENEGSQVSPALLAVQVAGGEEGGSILPPVEGEFPSLLPGVGANLPQDESATGLTSFENESVRSFTVTGSSTASPMKARSLAQAPSASMLNLGALPAAEAQRLEEDSAKLGSDGVQRRLRTGVGRKLSAQAQVSSSSAGGSLQWQTLADGSRVAAMGVNTAGARSVRLGLLIDALPAQARLRFYAPGATQMIELPAEQVLARLEAKRHGAALQGAGVFWAPAVAGAAAVVEVVLPAGVDTAAVRLGIDEVMHQAFGAADAGARRVIRDGQPLSGSCQRDFVCAGSASEEADAAVFLDFVEYDEFGRAESYSCSGMLIADAGRTGAPYLLTADHCIGNQVLAFDTDAYLFWRTTVCGMDIQDPRLALFAWGLDYLYSENERTGTDMTLLRPANSSYHVPDDGLRLAGWSASAQTGSQPVVGLHHPGGDHLMRSLGFASPSPKRNYLRVVWSEGTTEGGSSGSALLNAENQVIGTLWGGASSCDARSLPDDYGRFSVAYAKGLRNWLNTSSRPLAMVARTGHDAGTSELIFSDRRASPGGRRAYQAARLNATVDGLATGNPWRVPPALAALENGAARIVAVQDIDGDGRDDVVLRRPGAFGTEFFSVLQEREAGGVTTSGQWLLHDRVAPGTTALGMADFDGNGIADLVLYNPRAKLIQVVLVSRDGSGNYVTQMAELLGLTDENGRPIASLSPVAVGDFNGTGQAQILLQDRRFPRLALFAHWNTATEEFDVGVGQMSLSGTLVSTPDVNGDGRADFIFNARGVIRYALSLGGGLPGDDSYLMQAQQTLLPALPVGFAVTAVKDANGDGLVDLVLRNARTGEVRVARNPGASGPWPVTSVSLQQP